MKKIKLNIRKKLIASMLLVAIIPLIAVTLVSYYQSQSILSNKLSLTSSQTLEEVNNGLTNYFDEFTAIVNIISKNPAIIDVDNNQESIKQAETVLKNVGLSDDDICNVFYGTESGKFDIYPEQKMPDGYDATKRDWYALAIKNPGKTIITPPYKDIATGNYVIGISRTIENNGKTIGVIGINCKLDTLASKLQTKKIGNSGYIFITDNTGKIIIHPQNENLDTQLSFWDQIKSNNDGFIKYSFNGQNKFGAYQTNEDTGWKIVATLEDSELSSDTKSILNVNIILIIIMLLIATIVSLFLSKGIANNIRKLKEVFGKASNGDLTVSIESSSNDEFDELATSFNLMMENMSNLMKNVSISSNAVLETSTNLTGMSQEITASINEVTKAIEEVSNGAMDQVNNVESGNEEMNMLSKQLGQISANSKEIDKISDTTKQLSSDGLNKIEDLIEKSNRTKNATNQVNDIVNNMAKSAKEINEISATMIDITDQTNLLALNASIESARAGEAGKGFAVVADEIRKLAEESKISTEEIKHIITNIQAKSDEVTKAMELTTNIVNEQEISVNQTQQIFNDILNSIKTLIIKVEDIKSSIININEKKKSTVNKIKEISIISEQTASSSEEVTASAEEINATMEELSDHSNHLQLLADDLQKQIQHFKIN